MILPPDNSIIGDVHFHDQTCNDEQAESAGHALLEELEELMIRFKVCKINVALNPWKLKERKRI